MENKIVKINDIEIELKSQFTTYARLKMLINSYLTLGVITEKKEVLITMPNGTKLKYNDLNTPKALVTAISPNDALNALEDDQTKLDKLAIAKAIYNLPINVNDLGKKDIDTFRGLFNKANKLCIENGTVGKLLLEN